MKDYDSLYDYVDCSIDVVNSYWFSKDYPTWYEIFTKSWNRIVNMTDQMYHDDLITLDEVQEMRDWFREDTNVSYRHYSGRWAIDKDLIADHFNF